MKGKDDEKRVCVRGSSGHGDTALVVSLFSRFFFGCSALQFVLCMFFCMTIVQLALCLRLRLWQHHFLVLHKIWWLRAKIQTHTYRDIRRHKVKEMMSRRNQREKFEKTVQMILGGSNEICIHFSFDNAVQVYRFASTRLKCPNGKWNRRS